MSSVPPNGLKPGELERNRILNDIVENIEGRFAREFKLVDYGSLKKEVLTPVIKKEFNPEVQLRGLLRSFRRTLQFQKSFANIGDPTLKERITAFIEDKPFDDAVRRKDFKIADRIKHLEYLLPITKKLFICVLRLKDAVKGIFTPKNRHVKGVPVIWEDEAHTKAIKALATNVKFQNWGQNVQNSPQCTFVPTTVYGVQEVVRYAKQNRLRVRCGGYRHSWSKIFSQDNEIFISLLDLHQVTTIPDPMSILPGQFDPFNGNQLRTIELKEQLPEGQRLCRVGVSVTNEDFRRWAIANDAWSLPVDVILVEVTIGGVNGPICHGAGYAHKTVSDYVHSVEYVDCNGDLQTVDDPYLIKAAAGAFGLLGVVTHITFKLDAMTYAVMKPLKVDIGLAIPPIEKDDIPIALQSDWFHSNNASNLLADAKVDFEKRAANDYYSEWFWFTYQRKAWVNTWNTTSDPIGVKDYPDDAQTFLQWIQGWLGGVITTVPLFNALPGYWQAQLLAINGMAVLPPTLGEKNTPTIITALPNALHFRRGIQNMRVRDTEFQIPIPPRKDDSTKPDFSIVQRAWWDVIKLVYQDAEDKDDPSSPMRLTLELRIMGGSDVIMAPQRGNTLTASIEVLTIPDAVADNEWMEFIQKVADIWMSYGDEHNVRPHWAKEWDGLQFKGNEALKYMKNVAYFQQIAEFRTALQKIGQPHGWGLGELQSRFSNELFDKLIFE